MLKIPYLIGSKKLFFKEFNEYTEKYNNILELLRFPNKTELRIMTFNVYMWNSRLKNNTFESQLNVIEKINPDIFILQEALLEENDIKIDKIKNLGYSDIIFSKNDKMDNGKYYGNIVFSRYKIVEHQIIDISNKEFCCENYSCIYLKIKVNKKILHIFGTHLNVYDSTEKFRSYQLNKIFSYINNIDSENIVLLGDLNLLNKYQIENEKLLYIKKHDELRNIETVSKAIDIIINNNFIDSFDYVNKSPPFTTCCFDRRIDYIFIKKNFQYKIIDTNIAITNTSDHLPIIVDIDLSTREREGGEGIRSKI